MSKEKTKKIRKQIGQKIREFRVLHGKTQADIADMLGITFQQVQKYENGSNDIPAVKLYFIAKFLQEPITSFFEEVNAALPEKTRRSTQLIAAFSVLQQDIQRDVLGIVKTLAESKRYTIKIS